VKNLLSGHFKPSSFIWKYHKPHAPYFLTYFSNFFICDFENNSSHFGTLKAFILLFSLSLEILANISLVDLPKISITSTRSNQYLKSGLSDPYFSMASS